MDSRPPTALSPTKGRIQQLDGLRAIAILAVFLNHTVFNHLLWTGVDIFFVLSGFLITSILLDLKHRDVSYFGYFYTRRVFRILPPYLVTLVLAVLTFGTSFLHFWPFLAFFGMNLLAVLHPYALVIPLWSLAVEEQFYFLWPVVVLFASERWLRRVCIAALVFTPMLRGFGTLLHNSTIVYFLTPFRADLLCAGAALAVLWRTEPEATLRFGERYARWGTLVGYGLFVGSQAFPVFRLSTNHWQSNVFTYEFSLLGAGSLVFWALVDRGMLFRLLTWRPMRYLGQISYTFYLVHLIAIDRAMRWHNACWPLLAFAGTVAFASLSWFVMERPLIAFAAKLAPGGPPIPRT